MSYLEQILIGSPLIVFASFLFGLICGKEGVPHTDGKDVKEGPKSRTVRRGRGTRVEGDLPYRDPTHCSRGGNQEGGDLCYRRRTTTTRDLIKW